MTDAILTLQYPKGLKGLPIATTSNIAALRFFKSIVLGDWQRKNEEASDECEAILYRLEYQWPTFWGLLMIGAAGCMLYGALFEGKYWFS